MSRAVTRDKQTLDNDSTHLTTTLAPPPKLRRRPGLVAAAVVAICLGALLAGWAWSASTNTEEFLVATHTIERGTVITGDDLARVRLNTDPSLKPVPAAQLSEVVGQRAALDIAAGALLTPQSFSSGVIPAKGQSVVGVALTPAQSPGIDLQHGDKVRVVVTPAEGESPPNGAPMVNDATVVDVHFSDETEQTVVDLLVPEADAALLATRTATGNIALVLDSREK